ncbi:hypothetical protein RA263_02695 [Pseudomonas syringae pv. tagetis]|uniref:Uncharacterized protein n=1 Tax=Pseudomonas syringae pv. tagetis TaxID=129140 RepID=A0ABW7NL95_9PSED|nr:hypothetical protein [Pseudomonas syringae group genomosp. 7]UNB61745.1 hypothetical protein MME54_19150 [Pseudomonas syringae pv. helianthi]UNB70037.1 hypothetical protein MME58_07340 [Pseudomonas syringae pv. tagetis]
MLKALISFDPMNENGGELAFALKNGDERPADSDFKAIGSTKAIPWRDFREVLQQARILSPHPRKSRDCAEGQKDCRGRLCENNKLP